MRRFLGVLPLAGALVMASVPATFAARGADQAHKEAAR